MEGVPWVYVVTAWVLVVDPMMAQNVVFPQYSDSESEADAVDLFDPNAPVPPLRPMSFQSDGRKALRGGMYNVKYGGGTKSRYGGGGISDGICKTLLTAPMNSAIKCSSYSGCQATCMRDYLFPSGERQIFFVCDDGNWKVKGSTNDTIPQCHPTCIPPCQHGGSCVSPNTCSCLDNFSGPYCQYETKPCIGYPPTPFNARKMCNSETCTITCLDNHQFPDGSAIANIFCKEGEWKPARPDWTSVPDCKAICTPACQHGGTCRGFNSCNCPQQFRGPQCQYTVDVCDTRKLNFNGNYNCSETGGVFSCMLSCPVGMTFKSAPASVYSCDYSQGMYVPSSVPQCLFGEDMSLQYSNFSGQFLTEDDMKNRFRTYAKGKSYGLNVGFSDLLDSLFVLETKTPAPGVCYAWGGDHYRTFDGRIISFKSNCLYTLASDIRDSTFHIQKSAGNCDSSICRQKIIIFVAEKEYQLTTNDEGLPLLISGKRTLNVPTQLPDIRVDIGGFSVIATLQNLGVSLRWNLQDIIEVKVTEALWNRTGGLCGHLDGHASNDLLAEHDSVTAFANKWQVNNLLESCNSNVQEENACNSADEKQYAHEFCNKLMTDQRFEACRTILPAREYYEACNWDFCSCKEKDKSTCACNALAMFVRDCMHKGEKSVSSWRDDSTCPVSCSGGRVYKACGPSTIATCTSTEQSIDAADVCEEGCFCPDGTRLLGNECVAPDQCPCLLRGKAFQPSSKVKKDCNSCECVGGQWQCSSLDCDATCGAIGDPHYMTFDGRRFDFMGKCSYYLLQMDNYSVEAENVACDGKLSEVMGFSVSSLWSTPSCTKAVTVHLGKDKTLKLKQNKEITVNNEVVEKLPLSLGDAYVRAASSIFIQVELPDGVEVWWDGQTRVYIHAPASLKGKTKGLCGTFNNNQKDDFLTPEGDIEQDTISFANKWKTREKCENSYTKKDVSHPCEVNIQNKIIAEKYCANITGRLFADCHFFVDPTPYYEDCLYDVCSCHGKMADCLCPIIAAYGKACTHQGAVVDWRASVKGCGIQCPSGMQYSVCGNSCTRSCEDLSRDKGCSKTTECVEGCYCPAGRALDNKGECVPVATCSCVRNGMEYPAGHKEIRPGTKGLKYCLCQNGAWSCASATPEQIKEYPNESMDLKTACSATRHQEFTHCEPPEPVTCKNMHDRPQFSPTICRSGCVCKRGYVLDSLTKECVRPNQCPCHHGGKSYTDGHKIQEDCNTCSCLSGKWNCSEHVCPGLCSAWGDSHFRTFDDKIYDFQGACDYMLAKGSLSDTDAFNIALQIVPCGSSGVSCPKSVTLTVGSGEKHESVTFSTIKPVPTSSGLERITIREAGLFVFAEVYDLGIVLQWDRGTRVKVRADPKWKDRLKGLCGNYNNDEKDDFQTPSGGISEVSAQLFGDSWRLQPYCPEALLVENTCTHHPLRKNWAVQKCGILKSSLFRPCHSEVPIDPYIERCVFDACGCDQGGDCECVCTAVAEYAEQCNAHGVHIKWRSQEFCPIQCDETCSEYQPCIDTCPQETCDNTQIIKSITKLCQQDTCIEGCQLKKCPEGQVYHNLTDLQCVPKAECKPVCMKIGDKEYYEGDVIEGDDCYSCYCSRQKKTCTGQPCTTPQPTPPTATEPEDQSLQCIPGWTEWMSNDQPIPDKKDTDIEPLPGTNYFNVGVKKTKGGKKARKSPTGVAQCSTEMMVDIECRTVGSHRHYKQMAQDVECSLERGLVCQGDCADYEIRVLCQCGSTSAPTTVATTTSTLAPTTVPLPQTTVTERLTTITTSTIGTRTDEETEVITCDETKPLKPHETDCARYYQCAQTGYGLELLEKMCSPGTWYNPQTMMCDWPYNVKLVRPECTEEISKPGCVDFWSEWFNVSHPDTDNGDFELFSTLNAKKIQLCANNGYVKDIECKYFTTLPGSTSNKKTSKKGGKQKGKLNKKMIMQDYTASGDVMTCSKDIGLECVNGNQDDGMCEDYAIRVLCACETKDEEITNEVVSLKPPKNETLVHDCKEGQEMSACNIHCDQLCLYYDHLLHLEGKCSSVYRCVPGCWPADKPKDCPAGFRWREFGSCVRVEDCTCRSHKGEIVKPGTVVHETDCEICQCINNHYTCDNSACISTLPSTTTTTTTTTTTPATTTQEIEVTLPPTSPPSTTGEVFIIPSTVTPPAPCDKENITPLEANITASSSAEGFGPSNGNLSPNSMESWKPKVVNSDQYLMMDLGRPEPVYGVVTRGDLQTNDHVNSFYVLTSVDGQMYTYVNNLLGNPEVFRGGLTSYERKVQLFSTPVEARYVRINPATWSNSIALAAEVLGCREAVTSVESTTLLPTTVLPECTDAMGLDTGLLKDQQVTVSSSLDVNFKPLQASLSSAKAWMPVTNSPNEWIQFDFLDQRILTGISTKGVRASLPNRLDISQQFWVEAYKITYSHDGKAWNALLNHKGLEKEFLGNYDTDSVHTNYFDKPIHARYLRIFPSRWNEEIALRVEVLGCYKPYPELTTEEVITTTTPTTHTTPPEGCNVCEGAVAITPCPCSMDRWWDGEQCTTRTQCPCYVGHMSYAIGFVYDTEDCDQCICGLHGISQCARKTCPPCTEGLQAVLTPSCGCVCKPCPTGNVLCPTSNVCINETSWCDGVLDCPDDEVNCTTTTTPEPTTTTQSPTTTTTTTEAPKQCPPAECPEGFIVKITEPLVNVSSSLEMQEEETTNSKWLPFGNKSKWSTFMKGRKPGIKGGRKGSWKGQKGLPPHKTRKPMKIVELPKVCPEYQCIPARKEEKFCPIPKCSDGYELKTVETRKGECPRYSCELHRIPDGRCNVTGRTFDTFDGTEYKYDICDHILAQDKANKQWQIKLVKTCPYIGTCSKSLIIKQNNNTIQLNADLSVLYDGYKYTVAQVEKIGRQTQQFAMKQVSNKFIIFASMLDYTVIWDFQANVKINVAGNLQGQVNGLCGLFDGKAENDKQKPDGRSAKTSVDFGDSWGSTECETKVCPVHIQNKAWEMCSVVKKEPINRCEGAVNLNKFLSQCVEAICTCMEANVTDIEACRCQALLDVVTQCQANKPGVDLNSWRMHQDCPVECEPSLVYKECYDRICETSCSELLEDNPCPVSEGSCFPGCYCPDGYVRDDKRCVKPAECRDCVCEGFGKTRYVTFDRVDFTFNGNCTYVLTKTLEKTHGPKFQVLVTQGPCEGDSSETCVKSITTIYENHTILIGKTSSGQKLQTEAIVDGADVILPYTNTWAAITRPTSGVRLSIAQLQLDLLFHGVDLGFSVRLPSHLYRGKTEGLCGSCNANQTDDFKTKDQEIVEDADMFGKSWRAKDLPAVLGKEELCSISAAKNECTLLPPNLDPCMKIMDKDVFGKCHAVVDPNPFMQICHETWCRENSTSCRDFEAYARECQTAGICLDWRTYDLCPYTCPSGLTYKACGLGCSITCDNYELYRKEPTSCSTPPTDTCICPDGQVLKNDTCIEEKRCQPCDAEGHYPGDEWQPDFCTTCSCTNGNSVQCQRTQCPAMSTVCEIGSTSIVVKGTEADCCPKFICVRETKESLCTPPTQLNCGFGQVMKTVTTENGCQEFICQCVPIVDCPDISEEIATPRPSGMVAEVNHSNCCPQVNVVCKPETCPTPPVCREQYYEPVKRDTELCCPQYKCEPPKDKCLYQFEYIDSEEGGERKRTAKEKYTLPMKRGETWQDGPCHSCECQDSGVSCSTKLCPAPPSVTDYVFQEKPHLKECCPKYVRIACKVGDSVYNEGEVWPSTDGDSCKNITCVRGPTGELSIQETVETCHNDCPLGFKYAAASPTSQRCCGECEPVACVVNGIIHHKDQVWYSEDNCTTYSCDINEKQVQVITSQQQCPNIDECSQERKYFDGCCYKCNITVKAQKSCMPEPLPRNETVRLIRTVHSVHGLCENFEAIDDFTECRGICDSYTFYNQISGLHDSKCLCCQAIQYKDIKVDLLCEDGFAMDKIIPVPSTCDCEACNGQLFTPPPPIKPAKGKYVKS